MEKMSWDEYYAGFYDWSLSTQKNYFYRLSSFGDPEEVFEVVEEIAFTDQKFAARFVEKAMEAGVIFTPDHILELTLSLDKTTLSKMAERSGSAFTREQLEEIYMLIDDASFERIAKKQNIDIFADEEEAEIDELEERWEIETAFEPDTHEAVKKQPKGPGFFTIAIALLAVAGKGRKSKKNKHNGRCDGDCANCPPHYGYRYGRWYYGHDHAHGCQFGGNKCSGSMD